MSKPGAILTLNAGSSSIKAALFTGADLQQVFQAEIEGIGKQPHFTAKAANGDSLADEPCDSAPMPKMFDFAEHHLGGATLAAVGHRIVHGGLRAGPARVDAALLQSLAELVPWAPLHQPQNLAAIQEVSAHRPELPQVACFDTAFHHTLYPLAARFPIPRRLHEAGLRRYGFHGLSYDYIAGRVRAVAPDLQRVIVAHLGNGASLCALANGRSIDTTMGLTPLDGLMMGTRSGALDPGLVLALLQDHSADEVTDLLYHQSGLLGVSGAESDMRKLAASHDPAALEAIALFSFRAAREAGGMAASLGGVDGLVFTGGIGEHDAAIRDAICGRLAWLGIVLDMARPNHGEHCLSAPDSPVAVWVIPTNEELVIARQTLEILS